MKSITAERAAEVLGITPMIVILHTTGVLDQRRTPARDRMKLNVADVCRAYGLDSQTFRRCCYGRDQLLDSRAAADVLGISHDAFRTRVNKGKLASTIGRPRMWRFLRSEIEALANGNTRAAA